MKRDIPDPLFVIIENWFSGCCTCIKWGNSWSTEFEIGFGVRQGCVLLTLLFAIYIDDVDALCKPESNLYVILHADDILLLASTMTILDIKKLLRDCECELKKSSCLRIGQRHDAECANISSSSG